MKNVKNKLLAIALVLITATANLSCENISIKDEYVEGKLIQEDRLSKKAIFVQIPNSKDTLGMNLDLYLSKSSGNPGIRSYDDLYVIVNPEVLGISFDSTMLEKCVEIYYSKEEVYGKRFKFKYEITKKYNPMYSCRITNGYDWRYGYAWPGNAAYIYITEVLK